VVAAHAAARYRDGCAPLVSRLVVESAPSQETPRRRAGVRDKLLVGGGRVCSDAELLGLVLDAGADTIGGLVLAERVLRAVGDLTRLERLDRRACAALGRLWPRRLAAMRAALELGRRATAAPLAAQSPVRDAAAVYEHFRGRLPQLDREVFYVLLLDGKNRVQAEVQVSEGSLTAALVHPREVFAPAIRATAAAVILVHNHPSGDPTPSAEDCAITQRLRQVGELVGIRVLDHVVIGRGRYASMAEEGRW
jgi:DNA repair protein RadC